MEEPEDILSSSLHSLYSYAAISFTGDVFIHKQSGFSFRVPNPAAVNWRLHASSIWMASFFLANHINDIASTIIDDTFRVGRRRPQVLELGAGSGMPGILLAYQMQGNAFVTLSDYPDEGILQVLRQNMLDNHLPDEDIRLISHAWGADTDQLGVFDVVLAADTLWNPEQHVPFCLTLSRVLRRTMRSRIYLVAGLHTGRWTIQRFLQMLSEYSLEIEHILERKADGIFDIDNNDIFGVERAWKVDREGEDESEQRRWVVWIVLKWTTDWTESLPDEG